MTNEDILDSIVQDGTGIEVTQDEALAAMELARADEREGKAAIPYQLCPKCNGQGQVTKPPYTPGDVHEWVSSSITFQCDVCNGSKIILMFQPTSPKQ